MPRRKPLLLTLIPAIMVLALLSACTRGTSGAASFNPTYNLLTPTVTVTQAMIETEVPTSMATETSEPGPLNPVIVEQPTLAITSTPVADTDKLKTPAAYLNITRPGPGSRIASPIIVNAYAYPGFDNKVTLQLYGEDGRLMYSQEIELQKSSSGWVSFSLQIPFEITTAAETASLILVSYDGYGRRIALTNMPLILMQLGESDLTPAGFQYQPFYLEDLENANEVSGGTLHLSGYAHPYNTNPVIVELIKEDGTILTTEIVPIHSVGDANYMQFSADIEYYVSGPTPIRLTIRQMMDHAPYLDLALTSITLTLNP